MEEPHARRDRFRPVQIRCSCSSTTRALLTVSFQLRPELTDSMVYHTLVILLHRPFVETAASTDASLVSECWSRCEEAAKGTTALLNRYRAAFSLARAPYLIVSFTSYVNLIVSPMRPSSPPRSTSVLLLSAHLPLRRINYFRLVSRAWAKTRPPTQES
jgi:hypothetical protein